MSDVSEFSAPDTGRAVERFEASAGACEPYARVTIVRVKGASASYPGDRAIVDRRGELIGFTGGGCIRAAIKRFGVAVLESGKPCMIHAVPKDAIADHHAADGIELVSNGCPSGAEVDIFIEPVLPKPSVLVFGASGLAQMIADLAGFAGFSIGRALAGGETAEGEGQPPSQAGLPGFAVIATRGMGDRQALDAALASPAAHILMVASRKKAEHLTSRALSDGADPERVKAILTPAGLDIGAIGPAEIAVSVVAQLISLRRKGNTTA